LRSRVAIVQTRPVPRWRVAYDPKTDGPIYSAVPGFGHALLASVITYAFDDLRVSASLWEPGQGWLPLRIHPNTVRFELEHGIEDRNPYNERCIARVFATKKTIRGEYQGYSDLFVPVLVEGSVEAIIITGPFLRSRPTSAGILRRWRYLTGRRGHPADPEFAWYLSALQGVLVLEGQQSRRFQRLVECMARLFSGRGDAEKDANRASALRAELQPARFVDRMWEAVRTILDERSSRTWFNMHRTVELRRLGPTRIADHVLVGLASTLRPNDDPVDEAVRREELQRAAVKLTQQMGEMLAGQVGDRGVVFLSGASGSAQRKHQRLLEIAERSAKMARRDFGFSLHFGAATAPGSQPLSRGYLAALAAAEAAFSRGERFVMSDTKAARSAPSLRELRRELGPVVEEQPGLIGPRFERYLEAVSVRFGDRVESARAHLEVVYGTLSDPLVRAGAIDQRTLGALCDALDRSAGHARSMSELCAFYRRAVADLSEALERPVAARRDRSLRVAVEYIHQHYTEPLRLGQVARVAGFAPGHFSKLFISREDMPFEQYLRALRLERAKHLLADTVLDSTRIAELSGFRSAQYFCRVFRRELGTTPLEYRKRPRKYWPKRFESTNGNTRKSNVGGNGAG
jgi:AraC-like DNA-binding protein